MLPIVDCDLDSRFANLGSDDSDDDDDLLTLKEGEETKEEKVRSIFLLQSLLIDWLHPWFKWKSWSTQSDSYAEQIGHNLLSLAHSLVLAARLILGEKGKPCVWLAWGE